LSNKCLERSFVPKDDTVTFQDDIVTFSEAERSFVPKDDTVTFQDDKITF